MKLKDIFISIISPENSFNKYKKPKVTGMLENRYLGTENEREKVKLEKRVERLKSIQAI